MPVDFSRLPDILGLNRRNLDLISVYNPRHGFPLVDDKVKTKEILQKVGVPFPKTLRVVSNFLEIEQALKGLRSEQTFVVKPARGRAGGGIMLLEKAEGSGWKLPSGHPVIEEDLRKHLGDILFGVYSFGRMDDTALIEQKVVQHSFFEAIYGRGIADLRIIMFEDRPVMAMIRIPTDRSDGKANLHQGAMGVEVALDSGVSGPGLWGRKIMSSHPDTGRQVSGLAVPYWQKILDYAKTASAAVPLNYLGVDLVIDRNRGPMIQELNARPGLQIQMINRRGLVPRLFSDAGRER